MTPQALSALRQNLRAVEAAILAAMERNEHELNVPQLQLLSCLVEGPRFVTDLDYAGTNTSYNVKVLLGRGLVLEGDNSHDRRRKRLVLTKAGVATAHVFRTALAKVP